MITKIRGFTLIEVLVGISLLGIMLTYLLNSLHWSTVSWIRGEQHMTHSNRLARVGGFLQSHISTAKPVTNRIDESGVLPPLTGDGQSMSYIATLPPSIGIAGLYRFEIALTHHGEPLKQLVLRILPYENKPNANTPTAISPIDELVLLDNIDSISISYLNIDPQEQIAASVDPENTPKGEWLDHWEEPGIPELVKIKIVAHQAPTWPVLIIRPYARLIR